MTQQNLTYSKALQAGDMEQGVAAVTAALAEEGFGVLTEIDVQATFKKKLDVDYRPYRILGACNPKLAQRALDAAPEVGALLPCNVVVQQAGGTIQVDIINPHAMFAVLDRPDLQPVVDEVDARLKRVLEKLS